LLSLINIIPGLYSISQIRFSLTEEIIRYAAAIALLIVALQFGLSRLPAPVRRMFLSVKGIVVKAGKRSLAWSWQKFKLMFS